MAEIKIENINLSGIELFSDPDGFLTELDDNDVSSVIGGHEVTYAETCCPPTSCTCPGVLEPKPVVPKPGVFGG